MTSAVIEIESLTKSFGRTRALDGFTMRVDAGEVAAFLGPNGAGKSTTIRILLGLLRADGGSVSVLGRDPWRDAVDLHRRLAYVPGDVSLWPNLTGGETIDVLHRLRPGVDVRRRDELVERFELDPTKRCRTYSKGNRQKVALVAALSSEVELYVLDEPTSGLDPLMEARFQQSVVELRDEGRTVLLSSHILSEAETLGDSVTIIRDGATVQAGRLADLRHLTRRRLTVTLHRPGPDLAELPGVHEVVIDGDRVTALVDDDRLGQVVSVLAARGIRTLDSQAPSLEEVFLQQYAGAGS